MAEGGEGELPDAEALFEDAACGLLLTGADGTIRRVNRTFCRWTAGRRRRWWASSRCRTC
jgi:hypothetical protein